MSQSHSIRHRVAVGLMSLTLRSILIRLIGLVGILILARLLTKSEVGIVALGTAMIAIGSFLADGGMVPGLIRRPEAPTREETGALLGVQLTVFALVTLVTAVVAGLDEQGLTIVLMTASLILTAPRIATMVVLERELQYKLPVMVNVVETIVYNVLAVGAIALGAPLWSIGVAALIKAATGSAMLLKMGPLGPQLPNGKWRLLGPTVRFGIFFQAAWLGTMLRDQGLNFLLAGIGSTAALGAWSIAQRLIMVLTTLFEATWRVALPGMSRLLESGEEPRPLLKRALGLAAAGSGYPVVGLVATTPALVPLMFGGGWHDTIAVLPWICAAAMLAIPLGTVLSSLLWAQDEPGKVLKMTFPSLIATLGTAAALIPGQGVEGAGMGLLAGGVVYVISCAAAARAEFGWGAFLRLGGPTLASAIAAVAGWLIATEIPSDLIAVLASGCASLVLYTLLLALLARPTLTDLTRLLRRGAGR